MEAIQFQHHAPVFAKLGFGHCQDKKQVLCKNQCSPASEGGGDESKVWREVPGQQGHVP